MPYIIHTIENIICIHLLRIFYKFSEPQIVVPITKSSDADNIQTIEGMLCI